MLYFSIKGSCGGVKCGGEDEGGMNEVDLKYTIATDRQSTGGTAIRLVELPFDWWFYQLTGFWGFPTRMHHCFFSLAPVD